MCAHIVYLGRDEGPGVQKGEMAFLEDGAKTGQWERCPTQHRDAKFQSPDTTDVVKYTVGNQRDVCTGIPPWESVEEEVVQHLRALP